ncbi:unnamed protein product [Peniophora sp. CBMAI 1063]|nr:unnamed protein product [Peniophora sp. CBMAI 1063]
MEYCDSNSKLIDRFLDVFPQSADGIRAFVRRYEDVEHVPTQMLWESMTQVLDTGSTICAPCPEVEYMDTSEREARGPTPFFLDLDAPAETPEPSDVPLEDTLLPPFSMLGYPVTLPPVAYTTQPVHPRPTPSRAAVGPITSQVRRPRQRHVLLDPTRRDAIGVRKSANTPARPVTVTSPLGRTRPTFRNAIPDMYQDWIARTATYTLPLALQTPTPSGTRDEIRQALGRDLIHRRYTILRTDVLRDLKGVCTDILIVNSKSTPIPTSEPGVPVFILDHVGPFERTGWESVVQVLCCVQKDGQEDVYSYIGRYTYKPNAETRLSGSEWVGLPNDMKNHICRRIEYARDDHASKLCARVYLRGKREVVDPPAVRSLLRHDRCREDRLEHYQKPKTASLHGDLNRAFESDTEKLYLYPLQCEAYDGAFAQVLHQRLKEAIALMREEST